MQLALLPLLSSLTSPQPRLSPASCVGRRQLLLSAPLLLSLSPPPALAKDAQSDGRVKAATTVGAAREQIAEGYRALGVLLDQFDSITAREGGDGVRRVLGTVGTTSPVYLIEPAFRLLFDKDETLPMEYIEGVENVLLALQSADSEAYSAIFITFSSAKGKPEDYFKRSRQEVVKARAEWYKLLEMLNIKV